MMKGKMINDRIFRLSFKNLILFILLGVKACERQVDGRRRKETAILTHDIFS